MNRGWATAILSTHGRRYTLVFILFLRKVNTGGSYKRKWTGYRGYSDSVSANTLNSGQIFIEADEENERPILLQGMRANWHGKRAKIASDTRANFNSIPELFLEAPKTAIVATEAAVARAHHGGGATDASYRLTWEIVTYRPHATFVLVALPDAGLTKNVY